MMAGAIFDVRRPATGQRVCTLVMGLEALLVASFPRVAVLCLRAAEALLRASSQGQPPSKQLWWSEREHKPKGLLCGAHKTTARRRKKEKRAKSKWAITGVGVYCSHSPFVMHTP